MQEKWSGHFTGVNRQVALIPNHQIKSQRGEGQRWRQWGLQQQKKGDNERVQLEGVTIHLGLATA